MINSNLGSDLRIYQNCLC